MNRRQFLGASLGASIAAAALPWDPFVDWCRSWLGGDDTAKLQRLIDAALKAGQGHVVLPSGTHRISAPLRVPSGSHDFTLDGGGSRLVFSGDSALRVGKCEGITVQNFHVVGADEDARGRANFRCGIRFDGCEVQS
jgi:hypothetical protein